MMKKSGIALAIVGSLIGIGIILSFYGNYIIFEDLAKTNGSIDEESNLVLEVALDQKKSKTGIFAIQIIDFKDQTVFVSIIDPFETTIKSQYVNEESVEGVFDIVTTGTYKLVIEKEGEETTVFGVIGHEPDETKRLLAFVSLYVLVIGLIGLALMAIIIAVNRRKASS